MDQKLSLADLATGLSRRASVPMRYSEAFVRSFFAVIEEGLMHDNVVKVKGLGSFKLMDVEARESVNINTGERMEIAGHTKISFTPDPVLRDAVNKPFVEFTTVILSDKTDTALMEAVDDSVLAERVGQDTPVVMETQPAAVDPQPEQPEMSDAEPTLAAAVLDSEASTGAQREIAGQDAGMTEDTSIAQEQSVDDTTDASRHADEFEDADAQDADAQDADAQDTDAQDADAQDAEPEDDETEIQNTFIETDDNEMSTITPKHIWHHVLWITLLALFFTALGYCIDYYWRPFTLPEIHLSGSDSKTLQKAETKAKPTGNGAAADAKQPALPADTTAAMTADTAAVTPDPAQLAADYPQLEGGEYLIVGVLANDTMKVGKMLTKMAIQYYGDKDLYTYICVMNKIENPDIVPLNMPLLIPKLEKK